MTLVLLLLVFAELILAQVKYVATGRITNTLAVSSDGVSWAGLGTTMFDFQGQYVAYSPVNAMWLAGGGNINSLAYSFDGRNWVGLGTPLGLTFTYGIATYKRVWVVGGVSVVLRSLDGIVWNNTFGVSLSTTRAVAVRPGVTPRWVVGGVGSSPFLFFSDDSINFTPCIVSAELLTGVYGIAVSARRGFVAVGSGGMAIMFSSDGILWNTGPTDLAFAPGASGYGVGYGPSFGMVVAWPAAISGNFTNAAVEPRDSEFGPILAFSTQQVCFWMCL